MLSNTRHRLQAEGVMPKERQRSTSASQRPTWQREPPGGGATEATPELQAAEEPLHSNGARTAEEGVLNNFNVNGRRERVSGSGHSRGWGCCDATAVLGI